MKPDLTHLATFRVPDPNTMCYGGPRYGCFAVPYSRPFLFGKNPEYWIEAKAADDVCTWDTVDVKVQYREFATGNIKTMRPDWEDMIFIRSMFFDAGETVHMYVPGKLGHEPHVLRMWTPGRAMGAVETPYSKTFTAAQVQETFEQVEQHLKSPDVGTEEGDVCNRDGCHGMMKFPVVENCSCHINPPCHACVNNPLVCDECGAEVEEPETTNEINA